MANETRIITGKVRLSYVHLFKPYAAEKGQEEKYSCVILVPKTDIQTKLKIDAAFKEAYEKGVVEKWGGARPPQTAVANPIYDGDGVRPNGEPFSAECKGCWVFTASAKIDRPPQIINARKLPITNQSEIYSGMYARVSVNFFPYSVGGRRGIGCGLGNVQKVGDGEPLSGSAIRAEDEFDEVEIDPISGEPML